MTQEGRRLLAAATERPWELDGDNIYSPHGIDVAEQLVGNAGDGALIVAAVNQYAALLDLWEAAAALDRGWYADERPDGVHMRYASDLPQLLNTLRSALRALPPSRDSTPDPLE